MSHLGNNKKFYNYQKRYFLSSILILIILSISCFASESNDLSGKMKSIGLSKDKISKVVIVGDESSFTSGVSIVLTNRYIINKICNTFGKKVDEKSKIYSGYRRIKIYLSEKSDKPDLVLFLNKKDQIQIKDDSIGYNCQGLHEYIQKLMEPFRVETQLMWKEIEEKQKSTEKN